MTVASVSSTLFLMQVQLFRAQTLSRDEHAGILLGIGFGVNDLGRKGKEEEGA